MKKLILLVLTVLMTSVSVLAYEYKVVRAEHILVKTKGQAESIETQLQNGTDFEELAQRFSLCPSGKNGGDLGYFGKGQMVPEFEKAAFNMAIGEISEPIQTQFGWHIIRVLDKK